MTPAHILAACLFALIACASAPKSAPAAEKSTPASETVAASPFSQESPLALHYPPFDRIHDSDYVPAFELGMAEQLKEVQAIAHDPAPPTFDNTFVALEKTGRLLRRVRIVFNNLSAANTDPHLVLPLDALRALEGSAYGRLHPAYYVTAGVGTAVSAAQRMGAEIAAELVAADIGGVVLTAT